MRLMPTTFALLCLNLLPHSILRSEEPIPLAHQLALKGLPPELRKRAEQVLRDRDALVLPPQVAPDLGFPVLPGFQRDGVVGLGRLGVEVEKPSATLAEQLDLPKNQGVVLRDVQADSTAAKAGLKAHDILLEIDSKPVPRDLKDFDKQLEKFKDDQVVEVVLMRKGKTETIKELKVARMKENVQGPAVGIVDIVAPPPPPPVALLPEVGPLLPGVGGQGVMTTVFRTADRFTARHQEGNLIITLTGQGTKVKEILVQDGRESNTYEVVDKVPAAYRDKVKSLADSVEKPNVKVEVK